MRKNKIRFANAIKLMALGVTTVLIFLACDHVDDQWQIVEPVQANHSLVDFDTCENVETYAKSAATQLMLAKIQATHDDMTQVSWGRNDKGTIVSADSNDSAGGSDGDSDGDVSMDSLTEADRDSDYSETNNQEKGVDEADIVKTDGNYIYVLHKGELVVVQADADGTVDEFGRADVGGYATEMMISEDIAVIFSIMHEDQVPTELRYKTNEQLEDGVECWDDWCYNHPYSQIAVVDISDKSNPQVIRTIIYAGMYKTSRMVDGIVRAVFFSPIPALQMVWDWNDYPYKKDQVDKWCNDQITLNEERFAAVDLDDIIPSKLDSAVGSIEPMLECSDFLGPNTPEGIGLTTLVSIDVSTPTEDMNEIAVFGNMGIVYASKEAVYLTTARDYVLTAISGGIWIDESSGIHKFDISENTIHSNYVATGSVRGRMLDQFCLGEDNGYLRVATTTGNEWNSNTLENHVSVLQENGSSLKTVGHLGGLGMGEEIYAARFMDDRGFMVTFYETDPLYTLDMSDPTNPKAIGEWHGPGYSTYLHPVNENLLLSVGLDSWKVAISLYDVSNFSEPLLVEREFLPNESFESAAVWDHKAFLFKADDGTLVLPYSDWNSNSSGLLLYNVTEDGIENTNIMTMQTNTLQEEGSAIRSLYIEDNLFALSRCRVTSALLDDPKENIDTLQFYSGDYCEDASWGYGGGIMTDVAEEGW